MTERRSRLFVVAAALAIAICTILPTPRAAARKQSEAAQARQVLLERREERRLVVRIARKRDETWHWQRLMGRRLAPSEISSVRTTGLTRRRTELRVWIHRARYARKRALRPPHRHAWLCIHRFEGAWNDPDAPYYGGLQMDTSFQRTYGPVLLRRKGTADRWTPLEQMWVAERALRSGRGFHPWPNTARFCGLL